MNPLLKVDGIDVAYGASQALFGLGFEVGAGEVVTLLGRNGMGKSTTVKTVMGMLRPRRGRVQFDGREMNGASPHQIARAGIGLVPEGRHVFPTLTVRENLVATAGNRLRASPPWDLQRVYALFPRLKEREKHLGSHLSGGEQQMLAIGRALMTNPRLLILDEATEGLAPLIRGEIWTCLQGLKAAGLALIVIDKNIAPLLRLADRHFIVDKGTVVWSGRSAELSAQPELMQRFVGI